MNYVVAVDDEQLLFARAHTARRDYGARRVGGIEPGERVPHAVGAGIDNGLCRTLAKAFGL